jgi:hypothetical protein
MKESIKIEVIKKDDDNEHPLEIECDGDVLEFILDGKSIFEGDYSGNFAKLFQRALEIWGQPRKDNE